MTLLNDGQIARSLEIMRDYLNAFSEENERTPIENDESLDEQRASVIQNLLMPTVEHFFSGEISLDEFKTKIDSINKRESHWGFKGVKGQMFFNLLYSVADNMEELAQELRAAIKIPDSEAAAASSIETFHSFVTRLREDWVNSRNSPHKAPNLSSIPFFLSYFWQIQDHLAWPVYYTNAVEVMQDTNIWEPSGDPVEDYLSFKHIMEELLTLFSDESSKPFDHYQVEHVFWYYGGRPTYSTSQKKKDVAITEAQESLKVPTVDESHQDRLPDSYVPPIVAVLPRMAVNDESLHEAAKKSGTSLEFAFEKSVHAAFTVLGYEATRLGQGTGRNPDGKALANDDSYAIIWDAKVRRDSYSMGTDDRTIREYITSHSRDLKRKRTLRNIYYMIISGRFTDDYDEAIRSIKMDTNVNEVSLCEAEALVAMVDRKLRNPLQITLGPDGLQRLFSSSGIITAELVREHLL